MLCSGVSNFERLTKEETQIMKGRPSTFALSHHDVAVALPHLLHTMFTPLFAFAVLACVKMCHDAAEDVDRAQAHRTCLDPIST